MQSIILDSLRELVIEVKIVETIEYGEALNALQVSRYLFKKLFLAIFHSN